jgi:hypothetical protein
MKMYKCKLMGVVDSDGCYTCFMSKQNKDQCVSRVLCKKTNILEEMDIQVMPKSAEEQPMEAMEA